ncbi:MAG: IS30 family transposase, partial [Oscillospiraceae bacterium]|nr:IS30 family transposase [Oscillospiraceae bacterium]
CVGFQSSIFGGVRTNTYYCHPYSSWERGSNEKQNGMLRRWFPKGTDFAKITANVIQNATRWLNDYPRKLLDWGTSRQAFERELARLNAGVRCFNL